MLINYGDKMCKQMHSQWCVLLGLGLIILFICETIAMLLDHRQLCMNKRFLIEIHSVNLKFRFYLNYLVLMQVYSLLTGRCLARITSRKREESTPLPLASVCAPHAVYHRPSI